MHREIGESGAERGGNLLHIDRQGREAPSTKAARSIFGKFNYYQDFPDSTLKSVPSQLPNRSKLTF